MYHEIYKILNGNKPRAQLQHHKEKIEIYFKKLIKLKILLKFEGNLLEFK